jgi:hypothetical protein
MSQVICRRTNDQEKVLRVRVEFNLSIGDLINHVKRWENTQYSFNLDGSFNDYGLVNIDKMTRRTLMSYVKNNLSTYGENYNLDHQNFSNDEHEYWFNHRYDITVSEKIEALFPELVD